MSGQTEKALAGSLKKLLGKKTLEKITVKDITDDCGVNRQTFYYHFRDVYDLVEWIMTEEYADITKGVDTDDWKELVVAALTRMLEDKSFVMNTYYSLTRRQLDQFLQKFIYPMIEEQLNKADKADTVSPEDKEFLCNMGTYATVGIITEWIASGMKTESMEILDKMLVLLDGIIDFVVAKFASPVGLKYDMGT